MLTYIILTGMANLILNFYLLAIVEEPRTVASSQKLGLALFFIVSGLIGFIMIPTIIIAVFFSLIGKR